METLSCYKAILETTSLQHLSWVSTRSKNTSPRRRPWDNLVRFPNNLIQLLLWRSSGFTLISSWMAKLLIHRETSHNSEEPNSSHNLILLGTACDHRWRYCHYGRPVQHSVSHCAALVTIKAFYSICITTSTTWIHLLVSQSTFRSLCDTQVFQLSPAM